MAKTTSQIIAENKIKRAEAAAIAASRDEIHQQQMAELEAKRKEKETEETAALQLQSQAYIEIGLIGGGFGFILGALVMALFFKRKIKNLKKNYETRLDEARASLDRMIVVASKK